MLNGAGENMSQEDLQRLGTAVIFLVLVMTAPNWLKRSNEMAATYDAPWVYPGQNPVVQAQMRH